MNETTEPREYVVKRPFNSTLRRFREGDPVLETDDVAPHEIGDLKKRDFLAAVATKAAEKAVEHGEAQREAAAADAQGQLHAAWEAEREQVSPSSGEWPIHIADEGLFGRVISDSDEVTGVQVPGEPKARLYRASSVDRAARTISGSFGHDSAGADLDPPRPRRRR